MFESLGDGIGPIKTKICNYCGQEKQFSEFSPKSDGKDGLNAICKECRAEKARKRYIPKDKRFNDDYIRRIWIDAAKELLKESL